MGPGGAADLGDDVGDNDLGTCLADGFVNLEIGLRTGPARSW